MKKDLAKEIYNFCEKEFANDLQNESRQKIMQTWFNHGSADRWRHEKMNEFVSPLLGQSSKKWLTVGDGRYGLDAYSLKKRDNQIDVIASNIDDSLLKIGKEKGIIDNYSKENAEKLSFNDQDFDYTFCKEAYHHFPRPTIGLYEMLRVSKKAVALIEPNDRTIINTFRGRVFSTSMNILRRLRKKSIEEFEPVGNYIYSISPRDIEKIAWALRYPLIAFAKFNDHYSEGLENEPANSSSKLFNKVKLLINIKDFLSRAGLLQENLICVIIFKEEPTIKVLEKLKNKNFEIRRIPNDPYKGISHPF